MNDLTSAMDEWSFNVRDQALGDKTGTDDVFSGSFFLEEDKPGHEKQVRRSARISSRKKKGVKFLVEKEAEKTPRPPAKKKPKQDLPVPKIEESEEKPKKAAHVAAKKVEPVRATTKAAPKKVEKTEAPKPSTASLPKPVVKGRKTETDLGEFFKYKNDKGKVRRRTTNPQPFSFMVREEQKKKAREAAKQASAANVYKDDELEFTSKPAVRTTTAATVNRLAQPKKVAASVDDEKKEARRIAKARRTTRALSPKFRTAARAASRKFSTTENKPAEGTEKEEPKKNNTERKPFKPTVAKSPNFHYTARAKKRALAEQN